MQNSVYNFFVTLIYVTSLPVTSPEMRHYQSEEPKLLVPSGRTHTALVPYTHSFLSTGIVLDNNIYFFPHSVANLK